MYLPRSLQDPLAHCFDGIDRYSDLIQVSRRANMLRDSQFSQQSLFSLELRSRIRLEAE
jgi:hypothetical protein